MKQKNRKLHITIAILMGVLMLLLTACGSGNSGDTPAGSGSAAPEPVTEQSGQSDVKDAPQIAGLTFTECTPLQYATCFTIYNYEDGYSLIDIPESGTYLVVPEGKDVPEGLADDIVVLQKPLDKIYLAATSAMALFDATGSIGNIRMSGAEASGWYIDNAVTAMNAGDIIYAGKYSAPDYEMLIKEGCDLAIESTMIYHTPKVKEMIEDLGIPVLVDRSSYEEHPLGRTEWVKMYAVLTDKQAEAEAFFNEQAKVIEELKDFQNTGKTVAFFYVNSNGAVVVRNPKDYIPKMIDIAGGKYAFADLKTDQTASSIQITMEEFFATAVDADYLIYNGSIDTPLTTVDDLIKKDQMFAEFKAVKEGNVWTTGKSFYQATDIVGQMIRDVNVMVTNGDQSEMTFLNKVE